MLGVLSNEEMDDILESNVIGRIGCSLDHKVYVVPVAYIYDGESIFGHTVEGMKVDILRKNPQCCFEVDVVHNLANWSSVIAWGTFEELRGEQASTATQLLMDRISNIMPAEASQPPRMGPTASMRMSTFTNNPIIYRIKITERSGRYESS
jgi:nitroimidazol reductase NimA-like FMN-containing flavoprotein (pyridoxamine 5'-phosphate oxidase superfamily)